MKNGSVPYACEDEYCFITGLPVVPCKPGVYMPLLHYVYHRYIYIYPVHIYMACIRYRNAGWYTYRSSLIQVYIQDRQE